MNKYKLCKVFKGVKKPFYALKDDWCKRDDRGRVINKQYKHYEVWSKDFELLKTYKNHLDVRITYIEVIKHHMGDYIHSVTLNDLGSYVKITKDLEVYSDLPYEYIVQQDYFKLLTGDLLIDRRWKDKRSIGKDYVDLQNDIKDESRRRLESL